MRKSSLGALAIITLAWMLSAIQAAALPGDNTRPIAKGVTISGKISPDGKTFLADDDNKWAVSNPDALTRQEGRYVTIKCRMDLNSRTIRVFSVQHEQAGVKNPSNDSAFHR